MTPVCGGLINGIEMKKYNSTELIKKANEAWENISHKGVCHKDYIMGYMDCYSNIVNESNDIQNVSVWTVNLDDGSIWSIHKTSSQAAKERRKCEENILYQCRSFCVEKIILK